MSTLKYCSTLEIVFVLFREDLRISFWNYVSSLVSTHFASFYLYRSSRFSQSPEPLNQNQNLHQKVNFSCVFWHLICITFLEWYSRLCTFLVRYAMWEMKRNSVHFLSLLLPFIFVFFKKVKLESNYNKSKCTEFCFIYWN